MPRSYGNKVYVSNIDFNCSIQDLREAFQEVGEVAFVEMLKDNNNKFKGCAIVRFKENDIVDKAISEMNRSELNGRRIVVKDEKDVSGDINRSGGNRKRPREDDHYDRAPANLSGQDNVSNANTYGLSLPFLQSLGISLPLVNRVFVANMDFTVSEEDIKNIFRLAGDVVDVEIARGEDGKSKGYAFVEYEHPVEAVQAISMFHNQLYYDRPLNVQITRKERRKDGGRLPKGLRSVGMGLGVNGAPLTNVARAMETGNQSSILGAMPSGMDPNPIIPQVNVGTYPQLINSNLGMAANLQGAGLLGAPIGGQVNPGMGLLGGSTALPLSGAFGSSVTSSFGAHSNRAFSESYNSIQINKLPSNFTWKKLQDICSTFGEVKHAKITSRGTGIVRFSNEVAAKRAAEMLDNQRYEGRYLEAKLV